MIETFWTLRAKNEFDKIYKYWEETNFSNEYSEKLLDETLRLLNLVKHHNKMGRKSYRTILRRVLIFKNYSLTYQLSEVKIRVVSFFNNRQDPKKHIFI